MRKSCSCPRGVFWVEPEKHFHAFFASFFRGWDKIFPVYGLSEPVYLQAELGTVAVLKSLVPSNSVFEDCCRINCWLFRGLCHFLCTRSCRIYAEYIRLYRNRLIRAIWDISEEMIRVLIRKSYFMREIESKAHTQASGGELDVRWKFSAGDLLMAIKLKNVGNNFVVHQTVYA